MNILLKILKLLLITTLLVFLLSFTLKNEHKNERKINLIEFDMSTERFVTKEEILTSCFNWQHDNQIQNLDVAKIEENIRQIPQINDVNVEIVLHQTPIHPPRIREPSVRESKIS